MNPKRVCLLLLFIGMLLLNASVDTSISPTSYSPRPHGAKAFATLLSELGYTTQRWRNTFEALATQETAGGTTLVVAEPTTELNFSALRDWVADGNQLLVVGVKASIAATQKFDPTFSLEEDLSTLLSTSQFSADITVEARCHNANATYCPQPINKDSLTLTKAAYPSVKDWGASTPLLTSGTKVIASSTPHGAGELRALFSEQAIQNEFIDAHQNLEALLYLLSNTEKSTGTIYFDEFHHGYKPLVPSERKVHLQSILLFAGILVALLLLYTLGRAIRFGPPRLTRETRSSTTELSTALAMILYESNIEGGLTAYADAWKRRMGQILGIGVYEEDEAFCLMLARAGIADTRQIKTALQQLRGKVPAAEQQLRTAVQLLEDYALERNYERA